MYIYILFNLNVPDAEIAINSRSKGGKYSFTLPAAVFSECEELVKEIVKSQICPVIELLLSLDRDNCFQRQSGL